MKEHLRLNLLIAVPTILIGLFGGLSGAFFIFFHLKAARFRRKLLAKVSRPEWLNAIKILEPMLVAVSSNQKL
jgi:chloride channel 7